MAEQSSPFGLPPTVWIVLAASLAGIFAAHQHPFQDARPGDSKIAAYRHAPPEDQDIEARQWQDPLGAVAAARDSHEAGESVGSSPAARADAAEATRHTLASLAADLQSDAQNGDRVLVMGAMVPGAPYADDIENRRRTRYATLAGLYGEGYVPVNNEHIGYVNMSSAEKTRSHDIAAYEWLQRESAAPGKRQPRILLLWLDQDAFREGPLHRFSDIVKSIAPPPDKPPALTAVILGPADSDGLRAMSNEVDQRAGEKCDFLAEPDRDLSIYSSRATASDWWFVNDIIRREAPPMQQNVLAHQFARRCGGRIHLYRTTANDLSVAQKLYKELKYRGIHDLTEVALVTERDTLYARLMSRYFNGCVGSKLINDVHTVRGDEDASAKPLCFTYLKGLDGLTPPAPRPAGAADKPRAEKDEEKDTEAAPTLETSTGQGQLDYLRRLAVSLAWRRDNADCRRVGNASTQRPKTSADDLCGHHIKAIGVIGSDIYDKLLVLQALRRAFPRYVFFTTDLDARLFDEQNLQWTHELIIGSSLGLELRPELQRSIPPFRDTYQSSTYFSVMQAVSRFLDPPQTGAPEIEDSWTQNPHVFEIGRTQPFDLSVNPNPNDMSQCPLNGGCLSIAAERRSPAWSITSLWTASAVAVTSAIIVILIAGMAMGGTWVLDLAVRTGPPPASGNSFPPRWRLLAAIAVLAIVVVLSVWAWLALVQKVTQGGTRIPTPIFGGASHWAASLVEVLSILLVLTLVVRGQRKLSGNAKIMLEKFGFVNSADKLMAWQAASLPAWGTLARVKESVLWFPLSRLSATSGTRLAASAHISALEALVAQYLYRGRWQARFWRVLIATLVATATVVVLEYILMVFEFNLGSSLVNGFALIEIHTQYLERIVENSISLVDLFAMQFLIFWVSDAMLLTRSFMLALADDRPNWPANVLQGQFAIQSLPNQWAEIWLDLGLIERRTGWVARLIWYPSLVIAATALAALTVEFGDFGFASNPMALIISAGIIVSAAILLRRTAEWWRDLALGELNDDRLRALGANGNRSSVRQLEKLIERIVTMNGGAFAPYSQQPIVRAVLVPAITYGATATLGFFHLNV